MRRSQVLPPADQVLGIISAVRHQMTGDDERFGTLEDVIARFGHHGLSATGNFELERFYLLLLYVDRTFYIKIRLHVSAHISVAHTSRKRACDENSEGF